ncbi:DUF4268 domain-containing protein [Brevundimonas sp. SORGH_AS_0993]|uniref:DUF4268 domain-containing protein n=1 Tax=Brevundimonas sp. SORGH_AS_0993 TaxID=3041794 RepID=UPI002783199D|nr:DUF4268 domain-containing protein [Brevundimonas sp. SORGH_AS_0993]MDQ1154667.1 hypothetical protein [Brevundimonas sp. SORGH_AS_0993]
MYRIDRATNSIQALKKVSFRELGFRERTHLQEWIARQPSALGEDLLIIQKEFAGFSDTSERLDLLALDKQGSLVIIENKLDDTGRDVTWQALKYASYCSALTKEDIRQIYQDYLRKCGRTDTAEEALGVFFEQEYDDLTLNKGVTQRIILVAAKFRKEVTSTVLWLSSFRLRIQCFRATPFTLGDDLFLNMEQIIPVKDTEEFTIGLADKAKEEIEGVETEARRHPIRRQFWTELIRAMNATPSKLYANISPGKESWISAGSGTRGVGFNFGATQRYARAELYIDRGDTAENEAVFDRLYADRAAIEVSVGTSLTWERLDHRRACRIKLEQPADVFQKEQWPAMIAFMTDAMVRLERALKPRLNEG